MLVALAVDTALEDRRDNKLRDEYIEHIHSDTVKDRHSLQSRIEFFGGVQIFSEQFLDWLASDAPVDKETVLAAFYAAEVWPFVARESTYQNLQSTGNIRLIDATCVPAWPPITTELVPRTPVGRRTRTVER